MADPIKDAWTDAAEGFSSLGRTIKERYEGDHAAAASRRRGVRPRRPPPGCHRAVRRGPARDRPSACSLRWRATRRSAARRPAKPADRLDGVLSATVDTIGREVAGVVPVPRRDVDSTFRLTDNNSTTRPRQRSRPAARRSRTTRWRARLLASDRRAETQHGPWVVVRRCTTRRSDILHPLPYACQCPARRNTPCVACTTAAAVGVLAGFSIDGLDDLRLLVDEVFGVMGTVGVQRVDVNLVHWGEGMRVEMAAVLPCVVRRPTPASPSSSTCLVPTCRSTSTAPGRRSKRRSTVTADRQPTARRRSSSGRSRVIACCSSRLTCTWLTAGGPRCRTASSRAGTASRRSTPSAAGATDQVAERIGGLDVRGTGVGRSGVVAEEVVAAVDLLEAQRAEVAVGAQAVDDLVGVHVEQDASSAVSGDRRSRPRSTSVAGCTS